MLSTHTRDLLKRHAAGHAHDRDLKRKRSSSVAKQSRVSQACKTCASSKLKCDEEKPCKRCRERNLQCDWQDVSHDSSPEPLQNEEVQGQTHPPIDLSHSVAFSPMPTPLEDFPPANALLMTPQAPTLDPGLSPGVPATEQPQIEYGGMQTSTPELMTTYGN